MDPFGTGYWHKVAAEFPRDITVLYYHPKLVDENMEETDVAKGMHNHHIVFYTMTKLPTPFASCGNSKPYTGMPASLFMGGATEAINYMFTSEDGTFNSGF